MSNIRFVEDTHRYIDTDNRDLISVSKFTERFKDKVDWKAVAKKTATKETKLTGNTVTVDDILKRWDDKRDRASKIGTQYHMIRENELIDDPAPIFYGKQCRKILHPSLGGDKLSISINDLENDTVYPEMMIYDLDYMICGQSDKVIVIDDKIHIWDYKTDEEIKFKGYSNQWMSARKMLAPLDQLDECNGNIYSIKMSLYMYLLWKANKGRFKIGDIIVEHIHLKRNPDDMNLPILDENGLPVVLKIEQIKLPYRKNEVIEMLKLLEDGNR